MKHPIEQAAEIVGSQKALGLALGVTKAAVWQWMAHGRRVPVEHCPRIEVLTKGAVTRRDLRPEDWQEIWPELASLMQEGQSN
ncbi:helix-turn-helix domain-containing protein [Delftia acidovorans]|uniref:transcriptional regulator n=1 Tax=Delftia acidovorans TaxID=80866 RepID=UPI0018E866A2|nr:helix-turn-helix domain-containing protein [Delftia acidovorans]MBJ2139842.1 helix-turn-helix domain-containing protein [Delftia acidovorans]